MLVVLFSLSFDKGSVQQKKLLRRRNWSILIYPPPSLTRMGQEEWGHNKLFTDPLPPLAIGTNYNFQEVS